MTTTVFVLYLFIRSGSVMTVGPTIEIGEYLSLADCQGAADRALMISDEEPREWRPFIAQWACVERPSRVAGK